MSIDTHDIPAPPPPGADQAPEQKAPVAPPRVSLAILVGLVVLLGASGGWSILVVVAAIVVMIFLHELGHFLTAKWGGMKVTEFFLGFGPKLWSFRRGETEYGIKAIPAGAYVRVIGMSNLEEVDPADEPRAYRQQPFWRRMSVAVAGSTMHFLIALVCLWALLVFHGAPGGSFAQTEDDLTRSATWQVGAVSVDSGAAAAGLQVGDKIVAIDGDAIRSFADLKSHIEPAAGKTITVQVQRGDQTLTTSATVGHRPEDESKGLLGVGPTFPNETLGPVAAVGRSVGELFAVGRESIVSLGERFSPAGLADLGSRVAEGGSKSDQGPVVGQPGGATSTGTTSSSSSGSSSDDERFISIIGAAQLGSQLTRGGWAGLALFMVMLNIFVGVFNLVPLLPLDGGHVAIAVYEKIRSMLQGGRAYHADVAKLLPLTYAVVGVLIMIGVSSMYLDIVAPVHLN